MTSAALPKERTEQARMTSTPMTIGEEGGGGRRSTLSLSPDGGRARREGGGALDRSMGSKLVRGSDWVDIYRPEVQKQGIVCGRKY